MIWRLRIGRWRFTFTMAPTTMVFGVNSTLPDGNHILMWDFDDNTLYEVRDALETVQRIYELPNIYILSSGKPKHFIAYCFKRTPWRKAVEIVAFTKNVCYAFLKFAIIRKQFTLRVSPKAGARRPMLVETLHSNIPEDTFIQDLKNWVKYETLSDEADTRVKEFNIP